MKQFHETLPFLGEMVHDNTKNAMTMLLQLVVFLFIVFSFVL